MKTLIPDVIVRERLLAGEFHPIVLYEETGAVAPGLHVAKCLSVGDALTTVVGESMATFVAKCILQEAGLRTIHILEGK